MKKLLAILALVCVSAFAQTHRFGALDTNNTWTGINTFQALTISPVNVAALAITPNDGRVAIVKDGASATDCTLGGGSNRVWCAYNTTALAWQPLGGSGGGGGGGSVFKVNGSSTTDQSTINFQNSASFNGLTVTFSNPSLGNVQAGLSGSLGVAGGGTAITSIAGADYALLSTGANTWAAQQINSGASCGDSTHGLSYSTTTHTFGCQAITGSAAAGGSNTQLQWNNATALGGISGWTTNGTTTITAGSTSILDLSSVTAANAFKIPSFAGATSNGLSSIAYDTTSNNLHIPCADVDCIAAGFSASPASGNLTSTTVTAGAVKLADSSIAATSVVTAGANYTSGNVIQAAGNNKTTSDSGIAASNLVTASANFTSGNIPKAAGANKTLTNGYPVQGTDTNLLSSGTVSGTGATLCTDANGGATTSGCTSGAVVNSANQYAFPYYSVSGSNNQLSGVNAPTTNGFYFVGYNISASSAVAPSWYLQGVPVNAQSTSYSLLYSDRASVIRESGGTTATLTLPQVTGNTASNFPLVGMNFNSGNMTLAANAVDKIDNSSVGGTQTVLPNWMAFVYQDSSSAPGNWWTGRVPTFAAFGSNCGDATHAMSWSTTSGFGCQAITATAAAGGSDGQVQYNNATALAGVAGFTFDKTSVITLGVAGTSVGGIKLNNATSGTITVQPVTGALGTVTLSAPARSATLATNTGTLTSGNLTKFDASGNVIDASIAATAVTQTIASGSSLALGTSAIASGACGTATTATATGAATTDVLSWSPSADWSAITGYSPATTGSLIIYAWVSAANTVSFKQCNPTASSITPSAASVNWRVTR